MLTGTIIVTHLEKEAIFVKNTGNVKENLENRLKLPHLKGIAINLYLIIQIEKKKKLTYQL